MTTTVTPQALDTMKVKLADLVSEARSLSDHIKGLIADAMIEGDVKLAKVYVFDFKRATTRARVIEEQLSALRDGTSPEEILEKLPLMMTRITAKSTPEEVGTSAGAAEAALVITYRLTKEM